MTGHAIVFVLLCVLLFVLPLLPALIEWRLKRDAAPLKVVREYDGNIKHFANGFRHFLAQRFPALVSGATEAPPIAMDPASYQLVEAGAAASFAATELSSRSCARLLIGAGDLQLGEDMLYEKEVYAGAELAGGDRNSFRAILAQGTIRLGDDCAVMRWAHSDASLIMGARARLYGRASAENEICLQQGSRFGRMSAPVIRFGAAQVAAPLPAPRPRQQLALPDSVLDQSELRWLMEWSLAVPPDVTHTGDLVARKHVTIGDNASLHGNIKSNGDMVIGSDVHIDGALVATGRLQIGPRCMIKGPIVCDGQVVIGTGTVIGRRDCPTTITASAIRVDEGVLAHGTVWAREVGSVAAAQPAQA